MKPFAETSVFESFYSGQFILWWTLWLVIYFSPFQTKYAQYSHVLTWRRLLSNWLYKVSGEEVGYSFCPLRRADFLENHHCRKKYTELGKQSELQYSYRSAPVTRRTTVDRLSTDCRATVEQLSADWRPTGDRLATDWRPTGDRLPTDCRPTDGWQ